AENWWLEDEDDVLGVQVFTESGSFMTAFDQTANSTNGCLAVQVDSIEGPAFTDFEEVTDVDLPETTRDAEAELYQGLFIAEDGTEIDIYLYNECQPMIQDGEEVDDVFFAVNLITLVADWDAELDFWSDVLSSVEFDVGTGGGDGPDPDNGGDDPDPDNGGDDPDPDNGGDDPDPDNGGEDPDTGQDGTFVDDEYLWTIEWDESILTGREITTFDGTLVGITLRSDAGTELFLRTEEYEDIEECLEQQVIALENGGVEDLELVDLSDPFEEPERGVEFAQYTGVQDGEEVVIILQCREILVEGDPEDGAFISVRLFAAIDADEDEIAPFNEALNSIGYDGDAGNGGDDPDPDNGGDDPDPDNGGESEGGIDGDTYASSVGYEVSWDDSLYEAELIDEENPDGGVLLTSEGSYISILAAGDPDAEACVEAEVTVLEGFEGMGQLSESSEDGPRAPRDAESVLLEGTLESGAGEESDVIVYVECRPIGDIEDAELFVVISMIGIADMHEDSLPEWEAILDSIETD
ncbi:MAG: hypothetical protein M3Y37_01660, partial [Chloroflexota bacterium]|nr:hypothetical protein [Chloroflexota bacterium]